MEPTGGEWFGFPEYYFKQQDAEIKGGEAYLSFSPQKVMTYSLAYEGLVGKGEDGNYLTYMPAQELTPKLSYEKGKWKGTVSSDFVFQQNLVAEEETVSPGYYLVHLSFGYTHHSKKGAEYSLNLAANNLLNEAYYNHMSRFKQFGLLNMGRDISLHLKIKWNKNINKN